MKEKVKILVIGDVMLDTYVIGTTNRISPEAPCPVLNDCMLPKYRLGGAANVAYLLAGSSYKVSLCGVVGKDAYGSILLDLLKKCGINTKYLLTCGLFTTTKTRFLTTRNQQLLRVDNDICSALPINVCDNILNDLSYGKYDIVVFSDYDKGVITPELSHKVIDICQRKGIVTIVDVKNNPEYKYSGATLIKGNESEINNLLLRLNGNTEISLSALKNICEFMNIESIVMTLGKNGIIGYNEKEGLVSHPAVDVPIHDVTGAGDVVTAFIAMLLLNGFSFEKVLYFSNLAAQQKVSKVGTSCILLDDLLRGKSSKALRLTDIPNLHEQGKIVFTNGCFDILHAGHIDLLRKAKELGSILIVGLNSDSSISRLKGSHRPVNNFESRFLVLEAIEYVDYIIGFDDDTPIKLIQEIRPDVLVKGGDYTVNTIIGGDFVKKYGGLVITIPISVQISSTNILKSIDYE